MSERGKPLTSLRASEIGRMGGRPRKAHLAGCPRAKDWRRGERVIAACRCKRIKANGSPHV